MKDKTRVLLEKNQALIRALYRIPGDKSGTKELEEKTAKKIVLEEESVQGLLEKRDLWHLEDAKLLHKALGEAWMTRNISDLRKSALKFYSTILPNGVFFEIHDEKAMGAASFGNISYSETLLKILEIPLNEQSVIRDAYISSELYVGPLMPSLWNNIIANKLVEGKICPQVVAIPVFDFESVKSIVLTCNLSENFNESKLVFIRIYVEQTKRIIESFSLKGILQDL